MIVETDLGTIGNLISLRRNGRTRLNSLVAALWVGAVIVSMPQKSMAETVSQTFDTNQAACMRSMKSLIDESRGSASRVRFTSPSPSLTTARIVVSDGEVQIVCDGAHDQMTVSRVLDSNEDQSIGKLAANTEPGR